MTVLRKAIRFVWRGRVVEVHDFHPRTTLLDWLRLTQGANGTKEGCAEGDCGACTIVIGRERGGRLVYEPVNACIFLLGQADGTEIVTVEDLAAGGELHPVQAAMVDHHGSQCGFCTPGIVMSLFALYHAAVPAPTRDGICDALAGNLCRCTGYRPIVDAAMAACSAPASDLFSSRESETLAMLRQLAGGPGVFCGSDKQFFAAPSSEDELAGLCLEQPDATILAGATDVGLWVTKAFAPIEKLIWLGRVAGLDEVEDEADELRLGAMVSHSRAMPYLAQIDPDLGELMRRFGSQQVRVSGTVGGNIANGSPIGDLPPALIALGASVELRKGDVVRTLPLESFFIAYRKQDRQPGEFVRRLIVPRPGPNDHIRVFKVTKRLDEDISSVMMACCITVENEIVTRARVAFGGMAGIPKRASAVESILMGSPASAGLAWREAADALPNDFSPLDDHRASSAYRMQVGKNLIIKAMAEIAGAPTSATRIAGLREVDHAAE